MAASGAPCRACCCTPLGLALLPLASGFYSLLAAAVLLGFANGIGTGVVMIIGADLARASGRQGQFLGLWRLIGDVGISLAPLLAGVLVDAASLAVASLAVAGVGLAGSIVMAFLVAETLSAAAAAARTLARPRRRERRARRGLLRRARCARRRGCPWRSRSCVAPGIGSTWGPRASSHASAIAYGVAECFAAMRASVASCATRR